MCAFLFCTFLALPLEAADCLPDRYDETVEVERIFDGDTVRLKDGRRLRFVGIDTPEIHHGRGEDEPFAREALEVLTALVRASNGRLRLAYDRERQDRYERMLAHVFTDEAGPTNIGAELLARGMGTALTVPPNDRFVTCYREAEATARDAGAGLWSLSEYAPIEATDPSVKTEGVRIVSGRVLRTGESRRSLWINLEGGLALRIDREDLNYFPDDFDHVALEGLPVIARGRIYLHRDEPRMRVRHPADLLVGE